MPRPRSPRRRPYATRWGHPVAALVASSLLAVACAGSPADAPRPAVMPAPVASTTTVASTSVPASVVAAPAPSSAPASAPAPAARGDTAARVVGYYAGWEHEARAPEALPVGILTHVVYAFALVDADGHCGFADPAGERPVVAALQRWKRRAGAATLLAVGGWEGSRHFSAVASTDAGRETLAASCTRLARDLGFDGIDLDWEYPSGGKWPGRIADPAHHVALVQALRAQLRDGEVLTVATPASPGALETFGLASLAPLVDWFHVMAYDLAGPWDERTGHNAALRAGGGPFAVDAAIATYERAGVAPAQLVLGVPFYGHAYAGVDGIADGSGGLDRSFSGTPRLAPSGSVPFRSIAAFRDGAGWRRSWDPVALVPWLVHERDRVLVSYDDAESVAAKVAYAKQAGLGGMMAWELTMDDASWTLLRAIGDALGRPVR